ncbi:MAG: hypothetical protein J0H06_02815 [Actinobacteria bacterium]|nr:hypothetical protein [Actinomycetota bacterium]OJU84338.1 MAG: hypothetical protein BGO11_16475 [Solirubrobacterales bacterium 70-9]
MPTTATAAVVVSPEIITEASGNPASAAATRSSFSAFSIRASKRRLATRAIQLSAESPTIAPQAPAIITSGRWSEP